MPDPKPSRRVTWRLAFGLATLQLSLAIYAKVSSAQNILSDGACIGGLVGTLGNLAILAIVALSLLVLAFRSLKAREIHANVAPFLLLSLSSGLALILSVDAALHCTV